MTKYVLGFLIDPLDDMVLLIRKKRPDWQAGKLNGIGGHIEPGEMPHTAMEREAREEAGLSVQWYKYAAMERLGDFHVSVFKGYLHPLVYKQKTDEPLIEANAKNLPQDVIPNLHWLVPMAFDDNSFTAGVIYL